MVAELAVSLEALEASFPLASDARGGGGGGDREPKLPRENETGIGGIAFYSRIGIRTSGLITCEEQGGGALTSAGALALTGRITTTRGHQVARFSSHWWLLRVLQPMLLLLLAKIYFRLLHQGWWRFRDPEGVEESGGYVAFPLLARNC